MHYKLGASAYNLPAGSTLGGDSLGSVRCYQVPQTGSEPSFDGTELVSLHLSPTPSNHLLPRESCQASTSHKICFVTPVGVKGGDERVNSGTLERS